VGAALTRPTLGPVAPASRIVEVDMVRGFALFGVLLVNMYGFGADSIAWNAPFDELAFTIMHVFFESKSWTLFCALFGFGFAVQLQRAEARGLPILSTYFRRLTVLFAIGAVHTLLYDGDILMLYAELGLVLLVVRNLPTRKLLLLAVGLMLIFPLAHLATSDRQPSGMEEIESIADARALLELERRTHTYVTGSLSEVVAYNASAIPANPLEDYNWADSGLTAFALFLLGFSIGRSGVLRDIPGHAAAIARVRAWGLGFGLAAMAAERVLAATGGYAVFRPQRSGLAVQLTGDLLFAFGATALAFGYAATLILAAQTPRGRAALAPLAGVGRLALTVYLTQTLIFTTLFYGYGFGQAYRLGPVAVTAWAVVIFAVQVVLCHWWLKYFRFGPAEWLWRSLTYLKWQPLRRRT
jgi:uncharacterized protein